MLFYYRHKSVQSMQVEAMELRRLLASAVSPVFDLSIDFAPAGAPTKPSMVADVGETFSLRPSGHSYGWTKPIASDAAKLRRTPYSASHNSSIYFFDNEWEIAVPNGKYEIFAVSGDPAVVGVSHHILAENTTLLRARATADAPFADGSVTVDVVDGKLTLRASSAAPLTPINFLNVKRIGEAELSDISAETSESAANTPSAVNGTLSWTRLADLPVKRYEMQRAVYDGKVYLFGGFNTSDYKATQRVDVYDPKTNSYKRVKDLPTLLTHAQSVVYKGEIWLIGGFIGHNPGLPTKDVWIYNPNTDSYRRGPSLAEANGAGGVGLVGNKIVYFGGQKRDPKTGAEAGDVNKTWVIDLSSSNPAWVRKKDMPGARNHMGSAVIDGKVYGIGGQQRDDEWFKNSARVDRYDPATDTWQQMASLPAGRGHVNENIVVAEGEIYLIGGAGNVATKADSNARSNVYKYNPGANRWTTLNSAPVARKNAATAYIDGKLYLFGGGTPDGPHAQAYSAQLLDSSGGGPVVEEPSPSSGAGTISGFLWNDTDGDGVVDSGEGRTGARTVFLDANQNGKLDAGEKQVNSDANGNYKFTGLAAGTYYATRVFPAGYRLSNSSTGYITIIVNPGQNVIGANLGTTDKPPSTSTPTTPPPSTGGNGSIAGFLWNDSDADGVVDSGEGRTGSRAVFLDANRNGKLDAGEISTTSDAQGNYKFSNLAAGTYYATRVFPAGYRLSNNTSGYVTVTVGAGQNVTGINLGTTDRTPTTPPTTPTPTPTAAWFSAASLPAKLGETSGGLIGSKLYVIGDGSSRVYAYDYNSNKWSTLAARPYPAKDQLAEVVGGKLYVFGGVKYASSGQQVMSNAQVYDPATNAWATLKSLPYAVAAAQTAVINGMIYIAGGFTTGNVTTDRMVRYNPTTNTYTELASTPRKVDSGASGTDGKKLYIFGGRDVGDTPGNGYKQTFVYDPATNKWTTASPLPVGRGGVSKAPFVNGEFYVIGGETASNYGETGSDGVYDRVDIYNPTTNTWRTGPNIPTDRHGMAPIAIGSQIFVAGGGTVQGKSESSVVEYLKIS